MSAAAKKKRRKGLIILTVIFAFIAGLLFLAYSGNTHLTKSRYNISSSNLPKSFDGFRILQISDLHDKEFGEKNSRLLKSIKKENPDIIVATGDIVNSTDTPEGFASSVSFMTEIASDYDVYYVDGNHETAMDNINSEYYENWIAAIKDSGVIVLDNESTQIKKHGETINIHGLWFNGRYYNNMGDENAEKYYLELEHVEKLIGSSSDGFDILLTHNPIYFDVYEKWGAELILTGHMHGGVIRIPFKGGLISPERVYWPEYDAGEFQKNASVMIVNRGLGNAGSGYRFLNWPDISVITLSS